MTYSCPHCGGKGSSAGFVCGPGIHFEPRITNCRLCGATGSVSRAVIERYHLGQQIKLRRLRDKCSQREWALRFGIEPMELNKVERGYADAPECLRSGEYAPLAEVWEDADA